MAQDGTARCRRDSPNQRGIRYPAFSRPRPLLPSPLLPWIVWWRPWRALPKPRTSGSRTLGWVGGRGRFSSASRSPGPRCSCLMCEAAVEGCWQRYSRASAPAAGAAAGAAAEWDALPPPHRSVKSSTSGMTSWRGQPPRCSCSSPACECRRCSRLRRRSGMQRWWASCSCCWRSEGALATPTGATSPWYVARGRPAGNCTALGAACQCRTMGGSLSALQRGGGPTHAFLVAALALVSGYTCRRCCGWASPPLPSCASTLPPSYKVLPPQWAGL